MFPFCLNFQQVWCTRVTVYRLQNLILFQLHMFFPMCFFNQYMIVHAIAHCPKMEKLLNCKDLQALFLHVVHIFKIRLGIHLGI